jgi:hypothetical protein
MKEGVVDSLNGRHFKTVGYLNLPPIGIHSGIEISTKNDFELLFREIHHSRSRTLQQCLYWMPLLHVFSKNKIVKSSF